MRIQDDTGSGRGLKVNGRNEAAVFAISETEAQSAVETGDAYNINTGDITVSGDSTLIYFKNNEAQPCIIEAIAIGVKGSTVADMVTATIIANPTGGDLITDATPVDMNVNRNFGSSKVLDDTTLAYKGKVSGTVTGGSDAIQFYMANNSRLFAAINIELEKGSSVAIKIEGTTVGGSAYAALIMHIKDSER